MKPEGLREGDLIALGLCLVCQEHILLGDATFYVVEVARHVVDSSAVRRRAGLEMMTGSGTLARIMGPDQCMTALADGPRRVVVHERCALKMPHLLEVCSEPDKEGT